MLIVIFKRSDIVSIFAPLRDDCFVENAYQGYSCLCQPRRFGDLRDRVNRSSRNSEVPAGDFEGASHLPSRVDLK